MRFDVTCPLCGVKESIPVSIEPIATIRGQTKIWLSARTAAGGTEHVCFELPHNRNAKPTKEDA